MVHFHAGFPELTRARGALVFVSCLTLLLAATPAPALEPVSENTAINAFANAAREPALERRVEHVFSPRAWAPRGYQDGAAEKVESSVQERHSPGSRVDEMDVLKHWIGGEALPSPVAAAVTKDEPPPAQPIVQPLSPSHPNRRVRPVVAAEAGSVPTIHPSTKPVKRQSREAHPGRQAAPARRAPIRW